MCAIYSVITLWCDNVVMWTSITFLSSIDIIGLPLHWFLTTFKSVIPITRSWFFKSFISINCMEAYKGLGCWIPYFVKEMVVFLIFKLRLCDKLWQRASLRSRCSTLTCLILFQVVCQLTVNHYELHPLALTGSIVITICRNPGGILILPHSFYFVCKSTNYI